MSLEYLCPPAFIFFLYAFTQIIIDLFQGMFNTSLLKFTISIVITIGLNYLCIKGFRIVSWFIVFIPFVFLAVITSILLFGLGLDPSSGKLIVHTSQDEQHVDHDIRDKYKSMYAKYYDNLNHKTNVHNTNNDNGDEPDIFNYGAIGVKSHSSNDHHIHNNEKTKSLNHNTFQKKNDTTNKQENVISTDTHLMKKTKNINDSPHDTKTIQNNSLYKNENDENHNCTHGKYPTCQINTQIIPDS